MKLVEWNAARALEVTVGESTVLLLRALLARRPSNNEARNRRESRPARVLSCEGNCAPEILENTRERSSLWDPLEKKNLEEN